MKRSPVGLGCSLLTIILFLTCCNKEEVPVIKTEELNEITVSTAVSGGEITYDGEVAILLKGVCWSLEKEPTIEDERTLEGSGTDKFASKITGLTPGTTYYLRAYAVNKYGTGYGQEESFKTRGDLPFVETRSASNINHFGTTLVGSVNPNNLTTKVIFEYGTGVTYDRTVSAIPEQIIGDSSFTVRATISGLSPNTEYHYRVKAENSLGTGYGDDITFQTLTIAPDVITKAATSVTSYTSVLNGSVDPNNLTSTVKFEYGISTQYGQTVYAVPGELSGDSLRNVNVSLTGLTPNTTYHYRIKAENSKGTGIGLDQNFATPADLAAVSTLQAYEITAYSAKLKGSVNPKNSACTIKFEYGTSSSTYSTVVLAGIYNGNSENIITTSLSGLLPNTTYYYRILSENIVGKSYGNELTFKTPSMPEVLTESATSVSAYASVLNGTVDPNNTSCSVSFEYGLTVAYGNVISANPSNLSGDSIKNVIASLTGLVPNTIYHYRIKAENLSGVVSGLDQNFKTLPDLAVLNTLPADQVSYYTASLNGSVNPKNSPCIIKFEYGTTSGTYTSVSVVSGTHTGTQDINITVSLSGLLPNTMYYYRVRAENSLGSSYGNELSFTTLNAPPEPLINSLSATSVRYGNILTLTGENLNSVTQILIGSPTQSIIVIPKARTSVSMEIEIYNQQFPDELLPFSSFKVGIVYTGGTKKWSDPVNIQSSWTRLPDLPAEARYKAASFLLNGRIYIGCGKGTGSVLKDFWSFDPVSETWTRKADFPGIGRIYALGVSNPDYGYIGAGHSADNSSKVQLYDFYKYNAGTNTWSAIPDYPDPTNNFFFNFAISVNGHPYISLSNTVAKFREIVSDSWVERTGLTDLMDLPTNSVFAIGNSFYVISGYKTGSSSTDKSVWEYNTLTSTWTKKADFPGQARNTAIFFSVGNYGYVGCGSTYYASQYKDMWRYDPSNDKWIRIEDFPGGFRSHTVNLSAGNSAFAGFGVNLSSVTYFNDLWKFNP